MNNAFFEFPLLRVLNTVLLAGILAMLVLILLHVRQPIQVREPIAVEPSAFGSRGAMAVEVTNEPLQVEITR